MCSVLHRVLQGILMSKKSINESHVTVLLLLLFIPKKQLLQIKHTWIGSAAVLSENK